MSLTCTDCGLEHDFEVAPDIGSCLACRGQLVEDDGLTGDYSVVMRDLMDRTLDGLARARGVPLDTFVSVVRDGRDRDRGKPN